jgi:hypothetical protein
VIPVSQRDVIDKLNGGGICDECSTVEDEKGFIIPVLAGRWLCTNCKEDWEKTAKFYPEDVDYENNKALTMLLQLRDKPYTI